MKAVAIFLDRDGTIGGDRWSDMVAARFLLKRVLRADALCQFRHKWSTITPDFVGK
jgi:hypothetical protein